MEYPWHSLTLTEIFKHTDSGILGISIDSIPSRIKKFGKNILPEERPLSVIRLFLSQFHNPLIYILLVAFGISLSFGHLSDAIFIIIVLLINTLVGFYQEYKADRSILALKKIVSIFARVIRDGNLKEIDGVDLLPGDIFLLRPGDKIPADASIIESKDLKISESNLTGEWAAVHKKNGVLKQDTALEERKTPLQKKLARLSKLTGAFVLFIISIVIIIGYLQGKPFKDIFIASLALAVSAIPSGLLPAITVILVL